MLGSIFSKFAAFVTSGLLIFHATTTPPKIVINDRIPAQTKGRDQLALVSGLSNEKGRTKVASAQVIKKLPSPTPSFSLAEFVSRINFLKDEIEKLSTKEKNKIGGYAPFTVLYSGSHSGSSENLHSNNSGGGSVSGNNDQDHNGNGGATSTNQTGTSTNATSTNQTGTTTNATSTNATSTNATSTNATSTNATSTNQGGGGQNHPDISSGGFVSINFDDGEISAFDIGRPIMLTAGLPATYYITTHQLGGPNFSGYVTPAQVLQLQTDGFEIGNHTQSHVDLVGLATSSIQQEILGAGQDLAQMGISSVTTFAYPSGHTDPAIETLISGDGFLGARGASDSLAFNTKTIDPLDLTAFAPNASSTFSQIQSGIDQAIASHGWLIITFHSFNKTGDFYSVSPTMLQQTVDYLKLHNIPVATNDRGLREFMGR